VTVYYPTFEPTVSPLTLVTYVRELPFAGEILVRTGTRVEPDDVVARTLLPSRGRRFPVARSLAIAEASLRQHLVVEDGAEVEAGDVLVRVGRSRQRLWRSPIAGSLSTTEADYGYLIVTPPAQSFELLAHLKGFVLSVEPYRSVQIQSPVSLVQGAFGFGGEQHGVLRAAVTGPADELLPEMLDERSAFSILIGGGPVSATALARAVELQVRGLIVGSVTEEVLRTFLGYQGDMDWEVGQAGWTFPPKRTGRPFPLTLMVTEGIGKWPMCSRAFELLTSQDGADASLDGQTWLHGPAMHRPRVVIPMSRADPTEAREGDRAELLTVGREVRLLSADRLGQVGIMISFPRGTRPMACGARYHVAEVRLEDGHIVEVPIENLEVMGPRKGLSR